MIEALLATFLTLALLYAGGSWGYAFVMFLMGKIEGTDELDEHMYRLGVCAILAAGFLYLGAKL